MDQSYGIFESKNQILRAIIQNTIISQEGYNNQLNIEYIIDVLIDELLNLFNKKFKTQELKSDVYIKKIRKEIGDIAQYQTTRTIGNKRDAKYLVQYEANLKQLNKITKSIIDNVLTGNFCKDLYVMVSSMEQKKTIMRVLNSINATIINTINRPNLINTKHTTNIEIAYNIS